MAVTLLTLHLRVSPVELLTLSALFTSKAWTTVALACEHVAMSAQGVLWVTATGLTASFLTVVPVVRSTLITVMAGNILPARAGSSLPVTVTMSITASRLDGASSHTGAASAVVGQSVAIVTLLTVGTGRAVGVIQALEALACPGVT